MERKVKFGWEADRERKKETVLMLTGFIYSEYRNCVRLSELLEKIDKAPALEIMS